MATVTLGHGNKRTGAAVKPLDVTVLAGGPGLEREVSLNSGAAVSAALVGLGHRVRVCDIGPDDLRALDHTSDVVFIALHGEFGEDGTLQTELERRRIRYTGSSAEASRLAMDKPGAKRRFQQAGLPTPDYEVIDRTRLGGLADRFGVPAVVKPTSSGSSVDTMIVHTANELEQAAASLVEKYGAALVERYIRGPELTVGVLGDRALPVCHIRTHRDFYDYDAKYIDDDTEYLFDVALPSALLENIQAMTIQAHRALGCAVFSRADWMVDATTNRPYLLEINTIPGFTSHSLLPKAAARAGLPFDRLCQQIIDLSLDSYRG